MGADDPNDEEPDMDMNADAEPTADPDSDQDQDQGHHEYMLQVPQEVWEEFSGNVPKSMTYSEKITALIRSYNYRQRQPNTNEH